MTSTQKLRTALWIAVVVIIIGCTALWLTQKPDDVTYINQVNKDDKSIVPEFSLTDMNGKKVTAASWPGQYKLVYFGYSNCPDVCPTGLQLIAGALNQMPKAQQNKIQPLFITIDPMRDTLNALKIYTKQFHSKILGLTGDKDQIEKASQNFKVYAARVPEPEGVTPDPDEYLMDHSDVIYLLGLDSHFIKAFTPDDMKPAEFAKELQKEVQ